MDPYLGAALAAVLGLSVFRLLRIRKRLRRRERSAEIQDRLAELRKKRDEE
ncbi:hypothetical protein [Paenibacillus puerhi]|uniref:hypothetical protein n=1 Tax=Paenibacillus puerhi TaxID=2692622 RepID=UPI00135B2083|nr:hypothetical protein [Paenibacillus puerhi]